MIGAGTGPSPAARPRALATALVLAVAVPTLGWSNPAALGASTQVEQVAPAGGYGAPFSARVTVDWVDGRGRHTTSLDVTVGDGLVRVAGVAATGGGPLVLGDGWMLVARGAGTPTGGLSPEVERKYDIERAAGPLVAGRPTTLVVLSVGGRVRERLAIDDANAMVLRREVFGSGDRPVRTVTVTELGISPPILPATPAPTEDADPVDPRALTAAYSTPDELEGGYRRVGAFRRDDVVQVLYSDGLHGLSLFVAPGRLDREQLPEGGDRALVGRSDAWRYTWAGGEIVSWESGPVVRTLVGDAATDEVMAAARSVPPAPGPTLLERLRTTARQMAEVLGAS